MTIEVLDRVAWFCDMLPEDLVYEGRRVECLRQAPDGRFWVTRAHGATVTLDRDELVELGVGSFLPERRVHD